MRSGSRAEDEVYRPEHANRGVDEVHPDLLPHVEHCERDEYRERNHFLQDLELAEIEYCETDAVRRNLEQIFEQRDSPARKRGDPPRFVGKVLEVRIPRECHEEI